MPSGEAILDGVHFMVDTNTPSGADDFDQRFNPFDPRNLRLSQRFTEGADVRRILTTVPVRKPHRQEFVRVHPDENMRLETALLEFREERQSYLVDPALWPTLPGEATPKSLYTAVTIQGVIMLWPVRLPDENGRLDDWNTAAHEAAKRAETQWVRVVANMALGAYDIFEAMGQFPDPAWPDLTFQRLLEIAFRDRFIDSLDHPVLRRLRGEF
jgi:hypothetical protein